MWKYVEIICLGDFNVSLSATWYNLSLQENIIIKNLVVNDNRLRFHKFFNNHCLSVLSYWFSHKKCSRIIWQSPTSYQESLLRKFILACSWLCQYVSNCRVYNSYDFDSDHWLVITDICTVCTKVARYVKWAAISTKKHVNLNCLKQSGISERFVNTTFEKLENLDLNSTNSVKNDHAISFINSATEEALPMRGRAV